MTTKTVMLVGNAAVNWGPSAEELEGARLVTVLRMVAVQCAARRETIGEQRRHCSPAASRTFHIPAPSTSPSASQLSLAPSRLPHRLRGCRSLEINGLLSDFTR